MAQFIKNIMTLKKRYNCHVLIVHHSGKDQAKCARGHSSLRAAVDTEIVVKVDGSIRIASYGLYMSHFPVNYSFTHWRNDEGVRVRVACICDMNKTTIT